MHLAFLEQDAKVPPIQTPSGAMVDWYTLPPFSMSSSKLDEIVQVRHGL